MLPTRHQPGLAQHPEVARHRRAANREGAGNVARRGLVIQQPAQDFPPGRVGQGAELLVHGQVVGLKVT